jgi:hypothetical protein
MTHIWLRFRSTDGINEDACSLILNTTLDRFGEGFSKVVVLPISTETIQLMKRAVKDH